MAVWIVLNPIIRMFRLKNCILGQALMVNLFRFLTLFSSSHPSPERIGIGTSAVSGWSDSRLTNNSSLNGSVYIPELRVVPPS